MLNAGCVVPDIVEIKDILESIGICLLIDNGHVVLPSLAIQPSCGVGYELHLTGGRYACVLLGCCDNH